MPNISLMKSKALAVQPCSLAVWLCDSTLADVISKLLYTTAATRSTQPSILPSTRLWAGVKAERVHLCRVAGNSV